MSHIGYCSTICARYCCMGEDAVQFGVLVSVLFIFFGKPAKTWLWCQGALRIHLGIFNTTIPVSLVLWGNLATGMQCLYCSRCPGHAACQSPFPYTARALDHALLVYSSTRAFCRWICQTKCLTLMHQGPRFVMALCLDCSYSNYSCIMYMISHVLA